jgi:hypothetical protein
VAEVQDGLSAAFAYDKSVVGDAAVKRTDPAIAPSVTFEMIFGEGRDQRPWR